VYKTINGGFLTWSPVAAAPDFTSQAYSLQGGTAEQGWYDNTITCHVDPTSGNYVVRAVSRWSETTNGGV